MSNQFFKDEIPAQIMEQGLVLSDLKSIAGAAEILKRAIKSYVREFGGECSYTVAAMTHLAAAYQATRENKKQRVGE